MIFLGIYFGQDFHYPTDDHIQQTINLPYPQSKKECKQGIQFMRFIQSYRYGFARIAQPLSKFDRKDVKWKFDEIEKAAWDELTQDVMNAFKLSYPTKDGMYMCTSDCCDLGMAHVLLQKQFDEVLQKYRWFIIRFRSKLLPRSIVETAKSIGIKELYTAVDGVKANKFYLLRGKFN